MTKKITAILLSFIMVLTFMPTLAFAALPAAQDKYTDSIDFTAAASEATSNAKYAWTPASGDAAPWNTLTLKSFKMVISSDSASTFGIKVPNKTYINIEGDSSITVEATSSAKPAISAEGIVKFKGNSKLSIKVATGEAIRATTSIDRGTAQISNGTFVGDTKLKPTNYSNPVVINMAGIEVNPGTGGSGSTGGKIENDKLTLTYLDSYKISATSSTGAGLNYKSSNEKIVTVASDGTVKAVGAGTATITLTDKNNSALTKTLDVTVNPKSLTTGMLSAVADQKYTGAEVRPAAVVKDGTTTLKEGTDYTTAYTNNKAVAKKTDTNAPTVTVTGKGNYTGTISTKFNITNYEITAVDIVLDGTPKITVKEGTKTLLENTDYTVAYANIDKIGFATATITGKSTAYAGLKETVKFKVLPKKTAIKKLTVGKKKVTVNWNAIDGIDGYWIRYSTGKSFSNFTKVKVNNPDAVKKIIKNLKKGKKYYVKVRAFKSVWNGTKNENFYASWSTVKRTAKIK